MITLDRLPSNWIAKIQVTHSEYDQPCWEWTGAKNKKYGKVKVGYQTKQAHRAVWEHFHGSVPSGLELDHLCFNQICVNPAHLESVTRRENMRRRWEFFGEMKEDDEGLAELFTAVAVTGIQDAELALATYRGRAS